MSLYQVCSLQAHSESSGVLVHRTVRKDIHFIDRINQYIVYGWVKKLNAKRDNLPGGKVVGLAVKWEDKIIYK